LEIPDKMSYLRYNPELMAQYHRNLQFETIVKKYQLIASHTCRRSFCTNEYLKGTPPLFIMKISGHRSEKNFLKYIKVDKQVAAEKMLEFWKSQGNLKL